MYVCGVIGNQQLKVVDYFNQQRKFVDCQNDNLWQLNVKFKKLENWRFALAVGCWRGELPQKRQITATINCQYNRRSTINGLTVGCIVSDNNNNQLSITHTHIHYTYNTSNIQYMAHNQWQMSFPVSIYEQFSVCLYLDFKKEITEDIGGLMVDELEKLRILRWWWGSGRACHDLQFVAHGSPAFSASRPDTLLWPPLTSCASRVELLPPPRHAEQPVDLRLDLSAGPLLRQ